jgi:hypothetical protein
MGLGIIILQGQSNYGAWKVAVTNKIVSKGCAIALDPIITGAGAPTLAEYNKQVALGKSILAAYIKPELVEMVLDTKFTLVESFKLLESMYGERVGAGGLALLDKLKGLRLSEGGDAFLHIATFEALVGRLSGTAEILTEASKTRYFLLSFPRSYQTTISPLLKSGADDPKNFDYKVAKNDILAEIRLQQDLNALHLPSSSIPQNPTPLPPSSASNGEIAFYMRKEAPQSSSGSQAQCY